MTNRKWLPYAAFAGCLILLGVFVGLAIANYGKPPPWESSDAIVKRGRTEQRQNDYESRAQEAYDWTATIKQHGQPEVTCGDGKETPNCSEQYNSALDLTAQWATAEAADRMVNLTLAQFLLGILGMALLGYTLKYTRDTAVAGIKSAEISERNIEDTRNHLRAHVDVSTTNIEFIPDGRVAVNVTVKNSGETPARAVYFRAQISLISWPIPQNTELPITVEPAHKPIVVANDVLTSRLYLTDPFGDVERQRIEVGNLAVMVWGDIAYKDIFGRPQSNSFRRSVTGEKCTGTRPLMICDEGNEAT